MKNIVILTGAGVSAESGIATFRDSNGLWENHRVEDVASPEGFARDPKLVLEFYNQRRAQLHTVKPNVGHKLIAALEDEYKVTVVTQNIDDLHERAGSTNIVHLHGQLLKARPVDSHDVIDWTGDIKLGDADSRGVQMRPHIVWFGEDVPEIAKAVSVVGQADLIIIIGTSMQVYPAAGLVGYSDPAVPIIYIDPKPTINFELKSRDITTIEKGGSEGMEEARELIKVILG
ncbi:MAG: NAD-dependent deacetylase [Neolewinella sp.]|jgi:NAD-dependent deacetylase